MAMKKFVIGFDLGGTNSVLALVDKEGNVSERISFKTQEFLRIDDYVSRCAEAIHALVEKLEGQNRSWH